MLGRVPLRTSKGTPKALFRAFWAYLLLGMLWGGCGLYKQQTFQEAARDAGLGVGDLR